MQNARDSYISIVKDLIKEDEIPDAFNFLESIDEKLNIGIENDIVLQKSRYISNEKDNQRGVIPVEFYKRTQAQIKVALLSIVDYIPTKIDLASKVQGITNYNFQVPEDDGLQKVLGGRNRLVKIGWLEKARDAAKSVGRIVRQDGGTGTGFLIEGGLLLTNNHVLPDKQTVADSYIEFNFEEDSKGNYKTRFSYRFDPEHFITNTSFDFTRVKVLDNPNHPLEQWGFLELVPDAIPVVGDPVNIIQHPNGNSKQIAVTANEVLSIWGHHVFYRADTEAGSSGSPVFNQEWGVISLHQAGKLLKDGGLQVNAQGERKSANRGILISWILEALGGH
jgi:V8-like Glu-specific endopeptidase